MKKTFLEIYTYQGLAADQLQVSQRVWNEAFGRFLKLQYIIVSVSPCSEQLNRECSLFTDNGCYMIVGSAAFVPEEPHDETTR